MMRSALLRATNSSTRLAAASTGNRRCRLLFSTLKDSYEYVKVETNKENGVGIITLDRPQALNALCDALFVDLIHAARALEKDDEIGCLVLTGSSKAFAAGADISEMKDRTFAYAYQQVRTVLHVL